MSLVIWMKFCKKNRIYRKIAIYMMLKVIAFIDIFNLNIIPQNIVNIKANYKKK